MSPAKQSLIEKSLQIKIDANMEKLITEMVIDLYKSAEDARNKTTRVKDQRGTELTFEKKIEHLKDMYYGQRPVKTVPWTNCSNRSMKIAMAILEMLHSRMFTMVWNEDLLKWKPVERTDTEKAKRITDIMKYWIKVKARMHDYFDKWCKYALGFGSVWTEAGWDIKPYDTGKTITTPVTDDFGIQLYEKDGTPSETKEKDIKLEENTKTELVPLENVYLQEGQVSFLDEPVIFKRRWLYSDLLGMENQFKSVNVENRFHEDSKTLRESCLEYIKQTYNISGANEEVIKEAKLRSYPLDILQTYIKIDIDNDGFSEDIRVLVDPVNRIYLGGIEVKHLSKRGKRPIDVTKVNNLLDNPDSLEGYGILEMVLPLAEEIDAIFNQLTDANTLSVLRPGFYDPSGNLQPQNIKIAPNILIPVPDPSRNVFYPNLEINIERLLLALRTVLEFIERLTGASSYVMGKESEIVGGSGTATRTQAIVSAAEQRFAMPAQRLRAGAARILTLLLNQLQLNLPPGMETRILGEDGQPLFGEGELTTTSIDSEMDAFIMEDPALGSAEMERQLAQLVYATLMQNPLVATDPILIYKETALWLTKMGENPIEHLGPEPEGASLYTPEEENTMLIEGQFQKVRAKLTENHIQHMQSHQKLPLSPTMVMISPEEQQLVASAVQSHIQEHMMMLQQMLSMVSQKGAVQGGAPNGATGSQAQGNAALGGMGNIPGPFGAVEKTKEQGQSSPTPSM